MLYFIFIYRTSQSRPRQSRRFVFCLVVLVLDYAISVSVGSLHRELRTHVYTRWLLLSVGLGIVQSVKNGTTFSNLTNKRMRTRMHVTRNTHAPRSHALRSGRRPLGSRTPTCRVTTACPSCSRMPLVDAGEAALERNRWVMANACFAVYSVTVLSRFLYHRNEHVRYVI